MTTSTPAYELNRPVKVCRYCGADPLARTATPDPMPFNFSTAAEYHDSAKCVEGDEPSRKMGGPA
jgi:hypothetical protein